jgi:predicted Zn-dependent protease
MNAELEGYYLDGQTALRQRVRVRLTPIALQIITEAGETLFWPWEEVRQPRNFYGDTQIRLERGRNTPEVLLIPAPLFLEKLKEVAPERRRHFRNPTRRKKWAVVAFLSALGVIGIMAPLYLWGIPTMASIAAAHIPVSWEERLGQAVVEHLAPQEKQCSDSGRAQRVQEILTTLTSSLPKSPYTFRVVVVNQSAVNAFAVPGGTIVICQGLLEKTYTAEELAGVLAHEVQHVLHRHATRAMLQQVSIRLLLAALVGEARAMTYGLESAQAVGMLRYSRQYEEEADEGGIKLLMASGVNPHGMITFFETIPKESEKSLKLPAYLSTHPELKDRIQRLKWLAQNSPYASVKLLQDYNWKDIYWFCGADNPPR